MGKLILFPNPHSNISVLTTPASSLQSAIAFVQLLSLSEAPLCYCGFSLSLSAYSELFSLVLKP